MVGLPHGRSPCYYTIITINFDSKLKKDKYRHNTTIIDSFIFLQNKKENDFFIIHIFLNYKKLINCIQKLICKNVKM